MTDDGESAPGDIAGSIARACIGCLDALLESGAANPQEAAEAFGVLGLVYVSLDPSASLPPLLEKATRAAATHALRSENSATIEAQRVIFLVKDVIMQSMRTNVVVRELLAVITRALQGKTDSYTENTRKLLGIASSNYPVAAQPNARANAFALRLSQLKSRS